MELLALKTFQAVVEEGPLHAGLIKAALCRSVCKTLSGAEESFRETGGGYQQSGDGYLLATPPAGGGFKMG